jgi:predicted outer membrane repeat protein
MVESSPLQSIQLSIHRRNVMKTLLCLAVVVYLTFCFSITLASKWCIEPDGTGDAATIQDGIGMAANGDTVLLAAGTYTGAGNRDVDFLGKAITVTSEGGAAVTIIDCQGTGRGFVFQSGEGSSSVLSGITVMNGNADFGGAVHCWYASPKILHNVFVDNGSFCSGCVGGAVYCHNSSATIAFNAFVSNFADNGGGAIYGDNSDLTITDNLIDRNTALSGGGLACGDGSTVLRNRLIGNFSEDGGGMWCWGSAVISGNTLVGNGAHRGGGILCSGNTTVDGNVFVGNSGGGEGGAIYCSGAATISSNTLVENGAFLAGGGIYINSSSPVIENNIIAFGTGGGGIHCYGASSPTVTCCDIYGNAGGDALCGVDGGWNFSADPEFCGILGSEYYYLQFDSPCAPGNHPAGGACGLIGALPVRCGTLKTEAKTWGAIKSMYKD